MRDSGARGVLVSGPQLADFMSDPPTPPAAQPQPPEDEFAGVRARAGRHPALALGAAALALFIIFHVRADISYALSSADPIDLGDASVTFAAPPAPAEARPRGQGVSPEALAQAANHYVRLRGTPDRESALQVDTKGWSTSTQFFRLFGTQSRVFVHRREDPLPGFRAEADVFEGRLVRFSELSFEEAIRQLLRGPRGRHALLFAATTWRASSSRRGRVDRVALRIFAGDSVVLGPNDILAFELKHEGREVELGLAGGALPQCGGGPRGGGGARGAGLGTGAHGARASRPSSSR